MKKSEQIQKQIADLSAQLLNAIEEEAAPKPVVTKADTIKVDEDATFSLDGGVLTILDSWGDTATIDLSPVLADTWPRSETTFEYLGVERKGIVIGLAQGLDWPLVEVMETWNSRDGKLSEPTYKRFIAANILDVQPRV